MNKLTKILIFASIFLIPAYLIRFSIFGIPTNVLEILIYLTFISYLLEKTKINPHNQYIGVRAGWKELFQKYKIYIISISLIFLGLILSTLTNRNYQTGFGIIKGWFFDPLLFSFVLIQKIKQHKDIENTLKILYFSALTVSLIALEYFFHGKLTYDGRLTAFWSSPNYLAMFLAPSVFIGLYLLKNLQDKISSQRLARLGRKNSIIIFSLFIILFIIYLTYSYATWISIILSLAIAALITKNISKKFILISLLIVFIAFLTQLNNPKFKNIFSERSSFESRTIVWKSSFSMLKNNFLFGIGPGNFQSKYLEYQKYFPPYLEWAVPEPHNLYLAFWLESGFAGFTGFVILTFLWLKRTTFQTKNSLVTAVCAGIMLYFLLHGILDTTYWKNDLSLIFWITFSLGLLSSKIYSVKPSVNFIDKK